jgi:hypothetical protein
MNIFLDIDDVIFDWQEGYSKRFNTRITKNWSQANLMKKRLKILTKEKNFWLNLEIKNVPNFKPKGFVSARGIPKSWTRESLKINNIPGRSNIHQVHWGQSKIDLLKYLKCDIFIDDRITTFRECHKNGIFCLLMDAPHNKNIKTEYRIYNLDIDNIINLWHKLK